MELYAMVEKVLEAGRQQPLAAFAVVLILLLQGAPFLTGGRVDNDVVTVMAQTIKEIKRETKSLTGRRVDSAVVTAMAEIIKEIKRDTDSLLDSERAIGTSIKGISRELGHRNAEHVDVERKLDRIRDDVKRALTDLKEVTKVGGELAHDIDILKFQIGAGSRPTRLVTPPLTPHNP